MWGWGHWVGSCRRQTPRHVRTPALADTSIARTQEGWYNVGNVRVPAERRAAGATSSLDAGLTHHTHNAGLTGYGIHFGSSVLLLQVERAAACAGLTKHGIQFGSSILLVQVGRAAAC